MKLSKNLSLSEVTKSNTAIKKGIFNNPTHEHLDNLVKLAANIFQPIRDEFKTSIGISSGYRSKDLNNLIGGSKSSQHCFGEAIDLDADIYGGVTNAEIFNFIKENLIFDQLIWEFGTDEEPNWVHVSFISDEPNRMMILKAVKVKGRTKYIRIDG
jgi:hypothetical protein